MKPLSRTPAENMAISLKILFPIEEHFGPETKYQRELINLAASVLLSQHEELEKLRAWIDRNYQYVPEARP